MRDLHDYALSVVERVQLQNEHENNFWRLAERLGYRVVPGDQAVSVFGDPPLVMLNSYEYLRRRNSFKGMHEIAHLLFKEYGIEQDIFQAFDGDRNSALPVLETWCSEAAGKLLLPDYLVEDALLLNGRTPQAIIHMHTAAEVSAGVALRRYVYADDHEPAAAFISTSKGYVLDAARQYVRIPFVRGTWLPDDIEVQGNTHVSEESSVLTAPLADGRVVGVVAW